MPIKPEYRHHYGKAWRELRVQILERAGNRCECMGECGAEHESDDVAFRRWCGAEHRRYIARANDAPAVFVEVGGPTARFFGYRKPIRVVLTIAHLNHVAGDDRPENLRALCQLCHLRLDAQQHAESAAKTRARKRIGNSPALPLDTCAKCSGNGSYWHERAGGEIVEVACRSKGSQ